MSKRLNFHVVAEFVETREQINILKNVGCSIYQGWYYGKAEPLDIFLYKYLNLNNKYKKL